MARLRRVVPVFAALVLFGMGLAIGGDAAVARGESLVNRAGEALSRVQELERAAPPAPYRPGPLEQRAAVRSIDWPEGARELLALVVITAILFGFRASGLARHAARRRAEGPPPAASRAAGTGSRVAGTERRVAGRGSRLAGG